MAEKVFSTSKAEIKDLHKTQDFLIVGDTCSSTVNPDDSIAWWQDFKIGHQDFYDWDYSTGSV